MNGWVKHFQDGTSEVGSDAKVKAKQASWTRGRHNGLVAVDLHWRGKLYTLSCGEGNYWQSDTMVAMFSPGKHTEGQMQVRRISRQLHNDDIDKFICHERHNTVTSIWIDTEAATPNANIITPDQVDKWLIMELNTQTGGVKIFIQSARK